MYYRRLPIIEASITLFCVVPSTTTGCPLASLDDVHALDLSRVAAHNNVAPSVKNRTKTSLAGVLLGYSFLSSKGRNAVSMMRQEVLA